MLSTYFKVSHVCDNFFVTEIQMDRNHNTIALTFFSKANNIGMLYGIQQLDLLYKQTCTPKSALRIFTMPEHLIFIINDVKDKPLEFSFIEHDRACLVSAHLWSTFNFWIRKKIIQRCRLVIEKFNTSCCFEWKKYALISKFLPGHGLMIVTVITHMLRSGYLLKLRMISMFKL